MITMRVSATLRGPASVLTLHPRFPRQNELVVSIASPRAERPPRTSLAEWAEQHAEH